jgi:aminoglycoside 3-N-acetyltransferase I
MTTATGYSYRQLTSADIARLKDLLRVFADAFGEIETYQHAVPGDDYLTRLLNKPHVIAVVAMDAEEVAGGLVAYELDKFEQDRREIYIYDLAVAARHRRRGIARALIEELKRIASEREAYVIFVQADLQDAPAIALYDSLGAKETAHHFDIEVTARAPKGAPKGAKSAATTRRRE